MPPAALLDTHTFVWGQFDPRRLSARARSAIADSPAVFLSAVSIFEIAQKARLGKWAQIVPHLIGLAARHETSGGRIATVDAAIALLAGQMNWVHRDPFDRFIAATALERKLILISADTVFDAVIERVW